MGLFDRPADEKALGVLLKSPAIPGLTESLTDLRPIEWRTILSKLPSYEERGSWLPRIHIVLDR